MYIERKSWEEEKGAREAKKKVINRKGKENEMSVGGVEEVIVDEKRIELWEWLWES